MIFVPLTPETAGSRNRDASAAGSPFLTGMSLNQSSLSSTTLTFSPATGAAIESAVTVTSSSISAIWRRIRSGGASAAPAVACLRAFSKNCASVETVYSPPGRFVNSNFPVSSVKVVNFSWLAPWTAFTSAPGMILPEGSSTTPRRTPIFPCSAAIRKPSSISRKANR